MPSENGVVRVTGEEHPKKFWPVQWHWKVEPFSFEAKPKVGVGLLVAPVGPEVKRATGAVESVVKAL